MVWPTSGTISVENGSTTVEGTGTSWSAPTVKAGYVLRTVDGILYEISAFDGANQVTISPAYQGSTNASAEYVIIPTAGANVELHKLIEEFLEESRSLTDQTATLLTNLQANYDVWLAARSDDLNAATTHAGKTNNPHNVTPAQIGAQPTLNPSFSGDLSLNSGRLLGGIGAKSTAGEADWNHVSNARSGSGYTLLLGTAANGPGFGAYFHSFCFEYGSKNGSGNLVQMAIGYNTDRMYKRWRFTGAWSAWSEFATGYEEGIWSPSLAWATQTIAPVILAATNTNYTKIGNLVHVRAYIRMSNVGVGSNGLFLHGLPFANTQNYVMAPLWASNSEPLGGYMVSSGTYIRIAKLAGGSGNLTDTDITTGTELGISFTYSTFS